ncbi:hypothetical protein QEH42_gp181 [Microbacterium phage Pumpernickel]|uniref:Uncharacterized protein n=1 Tax=Microbacterium phage Pumpernickel TaxID=2885983 RepID=A0AAE9C2Z8_9CAUD|nr:hypothetical protein QEH42_gp181 [Microbacterium phage Pumpernickel]UDL16037.1 hypothetical protein SEA_PUMPERNICKEL_287 [Microbacterium phage Pumpernickel]
MPESESEKQELLKRLLVVKIDLGKNHATMREIETTFNRQMDPLRSKQKALLEERKELVAAIFGVRKIDIGWMDCEESPIWTCVYDAILDCERSECLVCGKAEERYS